MGEVVINPFGEEPLEEVRLEPAPLVRVLAQLSFPPVVSIAQETYIAPFQERLRARYPVLQPETAVEAVLGPQGLIQQSTSKVWRFQDVDDAWTVVLGTGSVSLETAHYGSRDDFISRLVEVFEALDALAPSKPVVVYERLGVRYVNMLRGEDATTRLQGYIRPEMYGPLVIEMEPGMEFLASVGQAHFRLDGPQMQSRWAKLPPGAALLPDLQPVNEPTWVLDIDVFFDTRTSFEPEQAGAAARHAATHAYRFFRWVMSEETFIAERRVDGT